MIYLDNAATSFPKPAEVVRTVNRAFVRYGANPGRSGHDMSVSAAGEVFKAREALNRFLNGYGSEFVSFFPNCTYALNAAIKGYVKKGEHIVISCLEHNSVARPVHSLKTADVADYSIFRIGEDTEETLWNFKRAFKNNTTLCVVTAVSNVFGNVLPIKELSKIAHDNGAAFFVDGAQGAGTVKLDMQSQGIDCLCVPGHKGLLGPMGTGALLHRNLDLKPIIQGGTGTSSFNLLQPEDFPERLESGTLNVPGICGLRKGVEIVERYGTENILSKETRLSKYLFNGLKNIKGVILYRDEYDEKNYAPLVSFNIQNMHSEQVSLILNENGIAVRGGYHCAPLAHAFYGTKDTGAVRVSPSFKTSSEDINILLNLVRKIAIQRSV